MDPSENSPLLASPPIPGSPTPVITPAITKSSTRTVVLLLLYLGLLDLGYELITPAQTRVLEQIYCKSYYSVHDPGRIGTGGVDEKLCKLSSIQGEVAMLKGWQSTFDSIGSE